jgi:Zn-dependent protease with chaperone function
MTQQHAFKLELLKVVSFALLSLFLIPVGALLFVQHAQASRDAEYVAGITRAIDADRSMSADDKAESRQFFRDNPPSSVCGSTVHELANYAAKVCGRYSELWQYHLVEGVSRWTVIAGVLILLSIGAIGAIAFVDRHGQYVSFVLGWNLLKLASAAEVIVQGALLVWLSFWVTAFFFNSYYVKLVLVAGILAAAAIVWAIIGIFRRPPSGAGVDGELVNEQDAPTLWTHVRDCARRLGTAPPDQIIAGIDANFFVTEAPMAVGERALRGRSLYVSLPLLRILERSEADAVLGHELAHFRGGDTASSAALGPKLVQYDHYCQLMRDNGIPVFYLVYLYRVIFELAMQRDSRAREFLADRVAAKLVSPQAIARSLVKIAAYSRYRSEIENQLFQHDARHSDTLGIAGKVAAGLTPYAASVHFAKMMETANVPHPFDSHPPMQERMRNVGQQIGEQDYGAIVTSSPASTWVSDINTADMIEQRMWAAYERRFAAAHEESLAYRYEPANDAEHAIVLKYFPPVAFALRGEKQFLITYEGIGFPGQDELLSWDRVADLKYTDGIGGDVLEIVHPEKGLLGKKTTKIKLPGIAKERDQFKAALGHYWNRHQVMRQQNADESAATE